ncbi:MAG: DUF4403 family protein [Cytophagales bacterium]|nr:MAG: DUF4403 family protein [Cytophagales bacterium]TAF62302.1 MAG: DUF4403 family protein [Cytophagales bacterium]
MVLPHFLSHFHLASMKPKFCAFYTIFFVLLLACGQKVNPEKPFLQPGSPLPQTPLSTLGIPLSIEVDEIEKALNDALKPVIYEDASFEDNDKDNFKVKLIKLGKAQASMSGSILAAGMPLRVEVEIRLIDKKIGKKQLISSSQKLNFEAQVSMTSSIAIAENWKVIPNTEITQLIWIKKPNLKVGRLKIPLDKLIERILKKKETMLEATLDRVIYEKLPLKTQVEKIWLSMQKPILLDKKAQTIWLINNPVAISAMQPKARDGMLTIPLALQTSLQTLVGEAPNVEPRPLPNLKLVTHVPDSFKIYMNCRAFYTALAELVNKKLEKKVFEKGGASIKVKEVSIDGGGQELLVGLRLKGDLNGHVYLKGKPFIDTAKQVLFIQDFAFDIHSEEVLLSVGDWLLNSTLKTYIEESVAIPMDSLSHKIPQKIVEGLNKGKLGERIDLSFSSFKITPMQFVMTGSAVEALVLAEGKSRLEIKKISK